MCAVFRVVLGYYVYLQAYNHAGGGWHSVKKDVKLEWRGYGRELLILRGRCWIVWTSPQLCKDAFFFLELNSHTARTCHITHSRTRFGCSGDTKRAGVMLICGKKYAGHQKADRSVCYTPVALMRASKARNRCSLSCLFRSKIDCGDMPIFYSMSVSGWHQTPLSDYFRRRDQIFGQG